MDLNNFLMEHCAQYCITLLDPATDPHSIQHPGIYPTNVHAEI